MTDYSRAQGVRAHFRFEHGESVPVRLGNPSYSVKHALSLSEDQMRGEVVLVKAGVKELVTIKAGAAPRLRVGSLIRESAFFRALYERRLFGRHAGRRGGLFR